MISTRTRWFVSTACAALAACSNESEPSSSYEADATVAVKRYVAAEIQKLTTASEAIQKAAPDADDDGWNAKDDKAAVDKMRAAWGDARDSYERIEGSIAVLFGELDVSTDERYDGFIESEPDDNLFDGEGVTGVHGIERILWADKIPERVVKFESTLAGYKKAAFPANKEEAEAFKNELCARLVTDTKRMKTEFAGWTLDSATAFRGMIGSMEEQSEKTTKAATGQDESRYSQRTLADMRANLDGAKAVFEAFKPWIDSADGKSNEIQTGLDNVGKAYAQVDGPALPEVPAKFNPSKPTDDDLASPYGKLWKLLNEQTDPESPDSLISIMSTTADDMKIPLIPTRKNEVRVRKSPIKLLVLALALCAGACLDNKLEPEDGVGGSVAFLAQQRDFMSYKDWMTFERDTTTEHGGLLGTTTVYVNELPADGKFPMGSILLKTQKAANSDDVTVHAMAKRGNGFNARGAIGWEYFELLLKQSGVPIIMWRGEKPPSGEMYQMLPGAKMRAETESNCNDCHAEGKDGMLGDDIVGLLN